MGTYPVIQNVESWVVSDWFGVGVLHLKQMYATVPALPAYPTHRKNENSSSAPGLAIIVVELMSFVAHQQVKFSGGGGGVLVVLQMSRGIGLFVDSCNTVAEA